MADITVRPMEQGTFDVEVHEGGSSTSHVVVVPSDARDSLGVGDVDDATLVEESFRFLLEREPKEAILARFDLPVISRYFPEYPDEIRRRVAS